MAQPSDQTSSHLRSPCRRAFAPRSPAVVIVVAQRRRAHALRHLGFGIMPAPTPPSRKERRPRRPRRRPRRRPWRRPRRRRRRRSPRRRPRGGPGGVPGGVPASVPGGVPGGPRRRPRRPRGGASPARSRGGSRRRPLLLRSPSIAPSLPSRWRSADGPPGGTNRSAVRAQAQEHRVSVTRPRRTPPRTRASSLPAGTCPTPAAG